MKKLNRKALKKMMGAIGIELNLPLPVGVCLGNLLSLCPPHSHCAVQMKDAILMLQVLVSTGFVLQAITAIPENVYDKRVQIKNLYQS